ncbi:hypothetical protein RA279_29390, partial [Pseudomonas syringae pv. tagetis]|uniref:hypothetical protein n=1 Tax=Pseudomonas syringae group genomosp. 7 TaxID=251699 RepID=UPI00376F6A98
VKRAAHHWAEVHWSTDALLESMRDHSGLYIVLMMIARALMILGHVRDNRDLWQGGAEIIWVVEDKQFIQELTNRAGKERF